jgi:hypothetical protein
MQIHGFPIKMIEPHLTSLIGRKSPILLSWSPLDSPNLKSKGLKHNRIGLFRPINKLKFRIKYFIGKP